MSNIIRTISPKGYNHGCADYAVFEYSAGDTTASCVEATSCTTCWSVGHTEGHVYAVVGEEIPVEELLTSADLDPLYSEEDVEYFLRIDPNWDESLPVPFLAKEGELTDDTELTNNEEED